jgi:hypothetical protein
MSRVRVIAEASWSNGPVVYRVQKRVGWLGFARWENVPGTWEDRDAAIAVARAIAAPPVWESEP